MRTEHQRILGHERWTFCTEIKRARTLLAVRRRFVTFLIVAAAVVLSLGSLRVRWRLDDYYQRWIFSGSPVYEDVGRKPLDAFTFLDGDARRNQRMIEIGMVPWWVDPTAKAAFWKPVTCLTHMLDYRLWPTRPWIMHAHSIVWFALWILSACLLYRRMMGATVAAALAGLLYAVAHARGAPVGWLANRNAMIAAVFGILAIYAHDRWRRGQARGAGVLAPILLALALLSAEVGVGAFGYLVAYAVTMERNRRRGLLALWPHVLTIALWRIAWSAQGYGVHAVQSLYNDPAGRPLLFLQDIIQRAPLYLFNQWTTIPADIHWHVSPRGAMLMVWLGVLTTAGMGWMLFPILRRSRVARFWGLGMLLATIPMCSATPMNRYLVFVGVGAMGLLGQLFSAALRKQFWGGSMLEKPLIAFLIGILVVLHLIVAPIGMMLFARYPLGPHELMPTFHSLPVEPDARRVLIFVNHPLPIHMLSLICERAVDRQPLPRSAQVLAPASTPVMITRTGERTLRVRPERGFFPTPMTSLGYDREHPYQPGKTIVLPAMKITIDEMTPDGRPAAVSFEFNVPLEDASLQWVVWKFGAFHEFEPPAVGEETQLAASGIPY